MSVRNPAKCIMPNCLKNCREMVRWPCVNCLPSRQFSSSLSACEVVTGWPLVSALCRESVMQLKASNFSCSLDVNLLWPSNLHWWHSHAPRFVYSRHM